LAIAQTRCPVVFAHIQACRALGAATTASALAAALASLCLCHDLDRQGKPSRAIPFARSERRTGAVSAGSHR